MDSPFDIGEALFGFFKASLKEGAKDAQNFLLKNKLGFVPKGMDYSVLKEMKQKPIFKELQRLIGEKHETYYIVLIGLYIQELDEGIKSKIVEEERNKIYNKNGPKGVAIINLAATGFLEGVIKFLCYYNLKNNTSLKETIDLYEKILNDWEEDMTVFIKSDMTEEIIKQRILSKISGGKKFFFVFASKGAIINAEMYIKKNFNEEVLEREYYYNLSTEKLNNSTQERVWIFEKKNLGILDLVTYTKTEEKEMERRENKKILDDEEYEECKKRKKRMEEGLDEEATDEDYTRICNYFEELEKKKRQKF